MTDPGSAGRFRPTSQEDLAPSGEIARLRANLAALHTLHTIQADDDRPASTAEQAVLAGRSGWGAVPGVFEERANHPNHQRFAAERAHLRELLSRAEYRAAERNTLNAHYTDVGYVRAIWDGLRQLGFDAGRVLEPGCGSGNFIGLAPDGAQLVGVELEPVTAAIAAKLYPHTQIMAESFADTRAPSGTFDLVVGNVPFGDVVLADKRHNPGKRSIHDHFIVKALHLTRPGGLVAVLTSYYTLDKQNPAARREMAAMADLVGAVRLPSGAHQAAAGTQAITDLLILRRREPGRAPAATGWEQVRTVELAEGSTQVNEYFAEHPMRVLGELTLGRGMYRNKELLVRATTDTAPALATALDEIVAHARDTGLTLAPATTNASAELTPVAILSSREDGHLQALPDATFTQVSDGQVTPHQVPATQAGELRELLALRDTATTLLSVEAATIDDTEHLDHLRAQLNTQYDTYLAAHGPLNRFSLRRTGRTDAETGEPKMAQARPPQGGFGIDPHAATVYALEDFDPVTQTARKADIFAGRIITPRAPQLGADSPEDALAICLDTYGEVRLDEVSRLLGVDADTARTSLGTLVFDEPGTDRLVEAAQYLSGNVRAKLRDAQAAAETDPRFETNTRALAGVVPRDLVPGEIIASLGASWISAPYIEQFLRETLEDDTARVRHLGGATWRVKGNRYGVHARTTWGTDQVAATDLMQKMLEQRAIEVFEQVDKNTRVFDPEASAAAQAKASEINDRFREWVWEDPQRAEDLARVYNDMFNARVVRSYAGATRSLPGLAATFTPRPHQVEAVARIVNEPAVGLFHAVGAGKTAVMAMSCMELKRLGLVSKPVIVVPNSLLNQFRTEFLWIYPQARLLAGGSDDLKPANRRRFVARAATGNYDAIIMSQSAFERIPMSAEARQAFMNNELDALRDKIQHAQKQAVEDGENPTRSGTVKRLQATLLRREEKIKAKLAKVKDPGVTFEQLGVDYVFRDEMHELKNDDVVSNIRDASIEGSDRAIDFRMKLDYLRATHGKRVCTGATATPLTNSISEAFVVIRQLRPDLLQDAGLTDFDAWAATFGEVVTAVELSSTGNGFTSKSRFARFRNVPELMLLMRTFGDVLTAADLNLPTPPLAPRAEDGERLPENVLIEPADELLDYIATFPDRADAIRTRQVTPKEDNYLNIFGDGQNASLDLRLVGLEQQTPGKIAAAADTITDIWAANRDNTYLNRDGSEHPTPGALQLVFCDVSTPSSDWNVYDELRQQLVAQGLPRDAIRFIHDAGNNDRKKGELFAACNNGQVAVIIGSTDKMGVGVNVQTRAVALHHLSPPRKLRPADLIQRNGRIERQGNQNPEIRIITYATKRSFDAASWKTIARKGVFIDQMMSGQLDEREVDDISDNTLGYQKLMAMTTDDPLMMDKAEADIDLARLERLERSHYFAQDGLRRTITTAEEWIATDSTALATIDQAIDARIDTRGDKFAMRVADVAYAKRPHAGRALQQTIADAAAGLDKNAQRELGVVAHLAGFDVTATLWPGEQGTHVSLQLPQIPKAAMRLYVDELADADPTGLMRRLEHHPANLEALRATLAATIDSQRAEVDRARTQLQRPFARHDELVAVRERVRDINAAIEAAAAPPRPPSPAATAGPADHRPNRAPSADALAIAAAADSADSPTPAPTLAGLNQAFTPAEHAWLNERFDTVANDSAVRAASVAGDETAFATIFDTTFATALADPANMAESVSVLMKLEPPEVRTALTEAARHKAYTTIRARAAAEPPLSGPAAAAALAAMGHLPRPRTPASGATPAPDIATPPTPSRPSTRPLTEQPQPGQVR